MGLEAWLTLAVVAAVTIALAREYLGPDLVMFGGLTALLVLGVLDLKEAIHGFANPALVTIGCLFVVAAAVQDTGALRLLSKRILGGRGARAPVLRLMAPVAAMSAFMNNTPIVALLIPAVRVYARDQGSKPSRFLMPLSFAAMLGGTCTLIGTSSNLVVSGLLDEHGRGALGLFEITKVGLPTAILGIAYMATLGSRLLNEQPGAREQAVHEAREYLVEMEVAADSPLVGSTVEGAGLRGLPGLFLVEILRADGRRVRPVAPEDVLRGGDHLVLTGIASAVRDLRDFPGLHAIEDPDDREAALYEVVVSERSPLVGLSVRQAEFRRRYGAAIFAVHRAGERIESVIGDIVLRPGDVLILSAQAGFHAAWRDSTAFYTVSAIADSTGRRYRRVTRTLIICAAMVLAPALTGMSLTISAMAAVVALLVSGCIGPRSVRQSMNWAVILLIGSALGIARAMDVSGAAAGVAEVMLGLTSALGPRGLLAGVYLLTVGFAFVIGNAAAAALVIPVALSAALGADIDPRPLAIGVAMGASAAFSTPVGYAANMLVYGPGGYRYLDFTRVGLPLNAICFTVSMVLIPVFWPL